MQGVTFYDVRNIVTLFTAGVHDGQLFLEDIQVFELQNILPTSRHSTEDWQVRLFYSSACHLGLN